MLAAATFVVFFQGYMVAPIIPTLSSTFGSSIQTVGLIVPAYLIPYGIATLAYGILADRIGIHRVMFASLAAFSALTILTATAQSIEQLALWRVVTSRGQRTYGFVLVNSMFHSGVFTWLGVYFEQKYHLGAVGIGLALLGYGVPGFAFGPVIGRAADRWGRAKLIPLGLFLGALAAATLLLDFSMVFAPVVAMVLSLGYDMTQPLFSGIVTAPSCKRSRPAN